MKGGADGETEKEAGGAKKRAGQREGGGRCEENGERETRRNGRKTRVNIQTEQSICPAKTGNAHRGACLCVFSFAAPSGEICSIA